MSRQLKILFLEDVSADAELESRELRRGGVDCVTQRVETKEAFVRALDEFEPDVILSDFSLPTFDGLSALAIARERRPDTPFIFVSGTIGEERAIETLKRGATDYILKTNLRRLAPAVRRAMEEVEGRAAQRRAEEETARQRAFLRHVIDLDPNFVFAKDREGRFTLANRAVADAYGCSIEDLLGKTDADFDLNREEVDHFRKIDLEVMNTLREVFVPEERITDAAGKVRWLQTVKRPLVSANGKTDMALGVATDITERKNQELKIGRLNRVLSVLSGINSAIVRIRNRQELFEEACRIAVEHGNFGMAWISEFDPATLDVTPVAWAGIDAGEHVAHSKATARADVPQGQGVVGHAIRGKSPAVCNDLAAEPDVGSPKRKEAIRRGFRSLIGLPLFVEGAVWGTLTLYAKEPKFFNEDELKLLNELAADISFALEYIAKEEKLNYLAYYDPLTGLPNRTLFDDRMTQRLRVASHDQTLIALVLVDLERFRIINDTMGRHTGDALIRLIGERLQSAFFDRDSLARVNGDLFAVLLTEIKDESDIARIFEEKIIGRLKQPFTLAGQELRVSAKAGVALFPSDATEPDALFTSAETALKQVKGSSDRYLFYARKMNAQVAARHKLENKLRRAVEREEFVLFYQPKIDLLTKYVTGLEALIRWNDPDTGLVLPTLFIPLLEETGMITEVGAWVLKRAVSEYAAWLATGLRPPRISVNVSPVQLKRKDFVARVQQAIATAGNPDHGLDLEITESVMMEDIDSNIVKLKAVRELGVGIAIDDFGTGHSSLRYLARLPIATLKVDRAFVQGMTTNPDDMAIVSAIISLAHNLSLKVVAEGVETEEQSKLLRLLKCEEVQGFLFSKPVPAAQVPLLLERGREICPGLT
ncbi:MAG: EAL domain-containing protein [Betaproteobacteria bacterium]|nr:EAL domain-containing protein [Betaproteobacteria bacterium]